MSVQSGTPNLAQYRTRLAEVLPTIVGGNAYKAPGIGQNEFPFWVISRPNVSYRRVSMREYIWSIQWEVFLAREKANIVQIEGLADVLDGDVVTVSAYFQSRSEFVSTSLTSDQDGYIPASLRLTAVSPTGVYPTKAGDVLGTSYTLELQHRVIYTPDYK